MEVKAWRPDMHTMDQFAILRPSAAVLELAKQKKGGKVVQRWMFNGQPLSVRMKSGAGGGDENQHLVRGVPHEMGLYSFELNDGNDTTNEWHVFDEWDVYLRPGSGLSLINELDNGKSHETWDNVHPTSAMITHYPLVLHHDTPLKRWQHVARQVAFTQGLVSPLIYNNPYFYWLPRREAKDAFARIQKELMESTVGDPKNVIFQCVLTLFEPVPPDQVLSLEDVGTRLRKVFALLKWRFDELVYHGGLEIDPKNDAELLHYWREEIETLHFYKGTSFDRFNIDPNKKADVNLDNEDSKVRDARDVTCWLLLYTEQRQKEPTWNYWLHRQRNRSKGVSPPRVQLQPVRNRDEDVNEAEAEAEDEDEDEGEEELEVEEVNEAEEVKEKDAKEWSDMLQQFARAQTLPPDVDVAEFYKLPLYDVVVPLMAPFRGDLVTRPPPFLKSGIYSTALDESFTLVVTHDGQTSQRHQLPFQWGMTFPHPSDLGVALNLSMLAGSTHLMWFHGTCPYAAHFVQLADTNGTAIIHLGRPSQRGACVPQPGQYTLWAAQMLGSAAGPNIEPDANGNPLVRWQLLVELKLQLTGKQEEDRSSSGVTENIELVDEAILEPGRALILPNILPKELVIHPLEWWREPLDPTRTSSQRERIPAEWGGVVRPRSSQSAEYELQGRYTTVAPIIMDPILATALTTVSKHGTQEDLKKVKELLMKQDAEFRQQLADEGEDPDLTILYRMEFLIRMLADDVIQSKMHDLESTHALWHYYHTVLLRFDHLIKPSNVQAVLAILTTLFSLLPLPEAEAREPRSDISFRLSLMHIVTQHAPAFLPIFYELFSPTITLEQAIAIIKDHYPYVLLALQASTEHVHASEPVMSTTAGQRRLAQTLRQSFPPAFVRLGDPHDPAVDDKFLRELERRESSTAAKSAMTMLHHVRNLPRSISIEGKFKWVSAFRVTVDPVYYREESLSVRSSIDRHAAFVSLLRITLPRPSSSSSSTALSRMAWPTSPRLSAPSATAIVRVPLYRHTVMATTAGHDRRTGQAYDPAQAQFGDAVWLAFPSEDVARSNDRGARVRGETEAAQWFRKQARRVPSPPLYRLLWEGAQREDWPEQDEFEQARRRLHEVAHSLLHLPPPGLLINRSNVILQLETAYPLSLGKDGFVQDHPALVSAASMAAQPINKRPQPQQRQIEYRHMLDYICTVSLMDLRRLVDRYKLTTGPDLSFIGEFGLDGHPMSSGDRERTSRRPHGLWIDRPSSYQILPNRTADISEQVMVQLKEAMRLAENAPDPTEASPQEVAQHEEAVRRLFDQQLEWGSRYVDLRPFE